MISIYIYTITGNAQLYRDAERANLPKFWNWGFLFGILSFAKTLFKVVALLNVNATMYLILRGTLSFWTVLLAWALQGEVPSIYNLAAIICQFGAIAVFMSPHNFAVFDPTVSDDDVEHSTMSGIFFTIISTLLSALNDVFVDKVLSMPEYKMEVKANKRVMKAAISTWASGIPLILSIIFITAPFLSDELALIEHELDHKDSGKWLFIGLSLTLPVAKGLDRISKYAIIDATSAFLFQLVEGVRSSIDVILVGIIFGDELSWAFFVAVVLSTCAAVVEKSGEALVKKYCSCCNANYSYINDIN